MRPLTDFLVLTKTLKRKTSKKTGEPKVSKASLDDDIDKTIAAFISKKLQSDSSASSDPTTGRLAVPVDYPPPKTMRKGDKVKLGAGTNGAMPTVAEKTSNRVESTETSGAEASIIGEVNERPTERGLDPTLELNAGGSQSGSKLASATLTSCPACLGTVLHPLTDCPVVQGGPDSIRSRIAQLEKSPGLAPSSEVHMSLRRFVEKARPIPSDSRSDSSGTEPSWMPVPSVALYRGSSTGAKPKIPKGHEISEVRVEARGQGSSSDSSTEGENDGDNPTQQRSSANISSMHLHLEDQLVSLLHGSLARRGPRRSVLDEIPSSSETECKSSSEDLVLDEEEDLSLQPSHKQRRKHPITRPFSIEPGLTSENEEHLSAPVYMDTSHDALDRSHVCIVQLLVDLAKVDECSFKVPSIGRFEDHESIDAEVESGQPEVDTYPREAGNQDHSISISSQTGPSKIDPTAPQSQSSTKIFGPVSPNLDVTTTIDVEAAKFPNLVSTQQQTGRVLVPPSSPVINGTAANTETEAHLQDTDDDVESAIEPPRGDEESDPIEPELTRRLADRPSGSTAPVPHGHQGPASRAVLNPPAVSDQPSRRSDRLASRQPSASNSGATLVPLTQVRRRMTSALEKSVQSAKEESGVIRNDAEEAREKSVRKQVRKSGDKPVRSTAQQSVDSGDDTSPSVAREDGSPISHVNRTNLPPSEQPKSNPPSVIDEPRTNSQCPLGKLSQSTSGAEKKTPVLTERVVVRRKKGDTQPLFIPGSSQDPRQPSSPPSRSENGFKMAGSSLPRKTPTRSTPRSGSQFRRLTDLTSNDILFFKSKATVRQFKNSPRAKVPLRFDAGDDGEDDDESSSSSDDRVQSSHIPKERRASGSMRSKGRGLSSLCKK